MVVEGAIKAPTPGALLEVGIALQLSDVPGEVLYSLFHKGELVHSFAELGTILAQQGVTALISCGIINAHANDDANLLEGKVKFLQFCNSLHIDNIRITVETLPPIRTALSLEEAQRLIVTDGSHRYLALLR